MFFGYDLAMRTLPFLNRKFLLDIQSDADESVMAEIFTLREYMVAEPTLKQAKHAILDLGAHKGFFALYVRALNAEVKIYAYEPEEDNFRALKQHLELNKIHNVFPKNSAVSHEEGVAILHVSEDSHNHSLVVVPGTVNDRKVNAVTLERIINKVGSVDLVKMDIEGAEFKILETAPDSVFEQCSSFFLETHEYTPEMRASKLKILFEKKGYDVSLTPSKYDKRLGFLWARRRSSL
jgi:FkbM family methyltransferase